jgi:hypothetical protein
MALLSTGTAKMMAREKRKAAAEKDYPSLKIDGAGFVHQAR